MLKVHRIILLDEQELIREIQDVTKGQEVLNSVFKHLNLLETAYFGLRYVDSSNQTHWLDGTKGVVKQLKGSDPFSLYFGVKFYAADPCKLLEEITRYQFFLQVKQDILQGRLPVSFETAAELGAYAVQSEIGDYDPKRHSKGYVSEFRFTSNQTAELEARIEERHKDLAGLMPAAAEFSYLEKVKWLEMYGVDLHPVLGEDNVEYFLGLTPSGIIVLRYKNKVGHYFWPRISKIYFKGKYFMIKICGRNNEENTYGFETPSKSACKHLWKSCVEHHAFFRLLQVSPTATDIFSLGSKFRYSGRTEKQAQADVQMQLRTPPHFLRTSSRRYQRRQFDNSEVPTIVQRENKNQNNLKNVSVPQPINSVYRSMTNLPVGNYGNDPPESPHSTRSAPWSTSGRSRGLYNVSPKSIKNQRSCSSIQNLQKTSIRSSSVDSQSSNDSRCCKRHKRHRSRRSSDNDSELSKCSSRSHRRHKSGNDSDGGRNHKHKRKNRSSNRSSRYDLVDSEPQWLEVQKRQAEGNTGVQQATVINNISRTSGYLNSGMETESEKSYRYKRKQHKKHRSRSRSPSDFIKGRLPDEVKKHLEFKLIDTEGMTETQLRDIPYKVVETNSKGKTHRKQSSPSGKRKHYIKNYDRDLKPQTLTEDKTEISIQQNSILERSYHIC
ncbi:4.1 G protein, putative [Pediculus humanus corporis]|uniref:Erythrocyte membrane protein band 4.1-like 4A n=1 Tax=Pediculus humanus subsp. corporis TaxID=121224 RepID=E0VRU7_PEDHC|nr:4.1 G protein, putative [Pediculus humanus corporis]EEB16103.1 4.1 G protein, putative [Pediculus humanus corporis]